jgi:hypothetical protein
MKPAKSTYVYFERVESDFSRKLRLLAMAAAVRGFEALRCFCLAPRLQTVNPFPAMAFIRFNGITKRFPGVLALDRVSFDVERGGCHALMRRKRIATSGI